MSPQQQSDAGKTMLFRGILGALGGFAAGMPSGRRGHTADWVKAGLSGTVGGLLTASKGGSDVATQTEALAKRQRAGQFRRWAVKRAAAARRSGDTATAERMEYAALQGTFQGYMAEPAPKPPPKHQIIDLPQGDGTFIKVALDPNNAGEFKQIGKPFRKQVSKTGGEWGTTVEWHIGKGMYQRFHLHKTDPSKHRPLGEPYRKEDGPKELTVKDKQAALKQRSDRRYWKTLAPEEKVRLKKLASLGQAETFRKRMENAQKALPGESEEDYQRAMQEMGFEATAAADVEEPPDPSQPMDPSTSVEPGKAEEAAMVDRITNWWAGPAETGLAALMGENAPPDEDDAAAAAYLRERGLRP
jgi:hypothetical protein